MTEIGAEKFAKLNETLEGLRLSLSYSRDVSSASDRLALFGRLRRLHLGLRDLGPETITKHFKVNEHQFLDAIGLGSKHFTWLDELLGCFAVDNATSERAVHAFVASEACFNLLSPRHSILQAESKAIQAINNFGLNEWAGDYILGFMMQIRAEEFGRVVGYAQSGLFEQDLQAYEADCSDEKPSLVEYLRIRIREHESGFYFNTIMGEEDLIKLAEIRHSALGWGCVTSVATESFDYRIGNTWVDHFFINRQNRSVHVGVSIGATPDSILQPESRACLHGATRALELLVAEPGSVIEGFKICPFVFVAGLVNTHTKPKTGSDGSDLISTLSRPGVQPRHPTAWGPEPMSFTESLQALARVPYLRFVAQNNSTRSGLLSSCKTPCFIAGVDTSSLNESARAFDKSEGLEQMMATADHLLLLTRNIAQVCIEHDLPLDHKNDTFAEGYLALHTLCQLLVQFDQLAAARTQDSGFDGKALLNSILEIFRPLKKKIFTQLDLDRVNSLALNEEMKTTQARLNAIDSEDDCEFFAVAEIAPKLLDRRDKKSGRG